MTTVDRDALVQHLSERAAELGVQADAATIEPELLAEDTVDGLVVFRAEVGEARRRRTLAGVIHDDGTIDSRPAAALAEVFSRWAASDDGPPDPSTMATVVGFLRGAGRRTEVVATEADLARITNEADRAVLALPERADVDGRPGVSFHWYGPMGLRHVTAVLTGEGRVELDEQQPAGGGA